MSKIRLMGSRVLVKQERDKEEINGIIIPGREEKQTDRGIVIEVGPGSLLSDGTLVPIDLEKGDLVLFYSYSGSPIKVAGAKSESDYLILNVNNIIASFPNDGTENRLE